MGRSVNKVTLLGNVGHDPENRETRKGVAVSRIVLATERSKPVGDGEFEKETEWHRITVWARLAEFVKQYVKKGDRLYIEGRLQYGSYEREDGVKVPTVDVVASEIVFAGGKVDPR